MQAVSSSSDESGISPVMFIVACMLVLVGIQVFITICLFISMKLCGVGISGCVRKFRERPEIIVVPNDNYKSQDNSGYQYITL